MLWEGVPSDETKTKLLNAEVKSILFNPCANTPEVGDFMTVMKQNIANLNQLLE